MEVSAEGVDCPPLRHQSSTHLLNLVHWRTVHAEQHGGLVLGDGGDVIRHLEIDRRGVPAELEDVAPREHLDADETAIMLHQPLPSAGVSIHDIVVME